LRPPLASGWRLSRKLVTSHINAAARADGSEVAMRILLTGATRMVGTAVLRMLKADAAVTEVLVVGRRPCGAAEGKVRELLVDDIAAVEAIDDAALSGLDGCIWAIGVSSMGMTEEAYAEVTETLTLRWARRLLALNPTMGFCYCSAGGADGNTMWARVRRRVEGPLQTMGFARVGCVRPGIISPIPGFRHRVALFDVGLRLFGPLFRLLVVAVPGYATSWERLGRAMIRVVKGEADRFVLESSDINRLGRA